MPRTKLAWETAILSTIGVNNYGQTCPYFLNVVIRPDLDVDRSAYHGVSS